MTRNLGYKLAILGCAASCLVGVAQANVSSEYRDQFDVTFLNDDETAPDVACTPASLTPVNRVVTYVLQNTQPAGLRLFDVQLKKFPDDDSGVGFDFDATTVTVPQNCIQTVDAGTNLGQGIIPGITNVAGSGQCTLILELVPPACHTTGYGGSDVPTSATFHQLLSIGIGSQQDHLDKQISAEVNVIGTGSQFAVLGFSQFPVNINGTTPIPGTGGESQLFGDLGVVDSMVPVEGFILPNYGDIYDDASDPNVVGAEADFESAYTTLIEMLQATLPDYYNCTNYNSPDNADVLTSGTYCFTNVTNGEYDDVKLNQTVTLAGPGNFYFYVDPVKHCVADDPVGPKLVVDRMCNLEVESTFDIVYEGGASADNVFWILSGNPDGSYTDVGEGEPGSLGSYDLSHAFLANGSQLDGTILGGVDTDDTFGNNITAESGSGDRPANVKGSLWSRFGLITLAGTEVRPTR